MGAITFSLDRTFIDFFKRWLPLTLFVETGTFQGDTVALAAPYFSRSYTIEISSTLAEAAKERFKSMKEVQVLQGDSAHCLVALSETLEKTACFFWLDAHWCDAPDTDSANDNGSPLLEELKGLKRLHPDSVILIDDARYFLAPPPPPNNAKNWPSLTEVYTQLKQLSESHDLLLLNDVLIYYPLKIKEAMQQFAQVTNKDIAEYFSNQDVGKLLMESKQKQKALAYWLGYAKELENRVQMLQETLLEKTKLFEETLSKTSFRMLLPKPLLRLLRRMRAAYDRVRQFFHPKLGQLAQHPPKEMTYVKRYSELVTSIENGPTISIVTPSFNQADFVAQTIDSVLTQAYPNLEYIVQDGGSMDGTLGVLQQRHDPRLRWESAPDRSQSHAINLGFAKTSGEIMAYLNSDDVLMPGVLSYVAHYFETHPDVDVIYSHRINIDKEGYEVGRWVLPPHSNRVLSWCDFIPQETLFWRRRIWDKAGGCIDESFNFAMDWDLLLRFRDAGARFKRIPKFFSAFRVHENQKTHKEIASLGKKEMHKLRSRYYMGTISDQLVRRKIAGYLLQHVLCQKYYRFRERMDAIETP